MKSIFFSIFLLVSTLSFGQKFYAYGNLSSRTVGAGLSRNVTITLFNGGYKPYPDANYATTDITTGMVVWINCTRFPITAIVSTSPLVLTVADSMGTAGLDGLDLYGYRLAILEESRVSSYNIAAFQDIADGNAGTAAGLSPKDGACIQNYYGSQLDLAITNSSVSTGDKGEIDVVSATDWRLDTNAIETINILDDAVTLAKQASGTANRLQGFDGSGNPSEITVSGIAALSSGNLAVTEIDGSTTNELETASEGLFKSSMDFRLGGTYMLTQPAEFSAGRKLNWGTFANYIGSDADSFQLVVNTSTRRIGIGKDAPWAKLNVKGLGNTSATFALAVGNSDTTFFTLRNDGFIQAKNLTASNIFSITPTSTTSVTGTWGLSALAAGTNAFAIGRFTNASQSAAFAIGDQSEATGSSAFACGNYVFASGSGASSYGASVSSPVAGGIILGKGVAPIALSTGTGGLQLSFSSNPVFTINGYQTGSSVTWSASGTTITATGHGFSLAGQTVGFYNTSTGVNWRKIVAIPDANTLTVDASLSITSGTVIYNNSGSTPLYAMSDGYNRNFLGMSRIGQITLSEYGSASTLTGTTTGYVALDASGNTYPDRTLVKGTDRNSTTDISYASTDLNARVKLDDTTDNSDFTVYTLNASPTSGDIIYIRNVGTTNDANDGVQINGNGNNIMGAATYEFATAGTIQLRYTTNGTSEWEIY